MCYSIAFRYVYADSKCNSTAISQQWLWTKNGQLLNMKNLQCIAIGYKLQENVSFSLTFQKCVANEKTQVWRCDPQDSYNVREKMKSGYLYYRHDHDNNRVVSNKSAALKWKRYGSNEALCSEGKMRYKHFGWIPPKPFQKKTCSFMIHNLTNHFSIHDSKVYTGSFKGQCKQLLSLSLGDERFSISGSNFNFLKIPEWL